MGRRIQQIQGDSRPEVKDLIPGVPFGQFGQRLSFGNRGRDLGDAGVAVRYDAAMKCQHQTP